METFLCLLPPNLLLQTPATAAPKKAQGSLAQPAVEPSKSGAQDFFEGVRQGVREPGASATDKAPKRVEVNGKADAKQTPVADKWQALAWRQGQSQRATQDDSADKPVDDTTASADPALVVP